MTQCKSTFPLTKGGAVFCVKREGHPGDHRGVGKQWRVMEVGDGFEVGMVVSVKITEPLSARKIPSLPALEAAVLVTVSVGDDPWSTYWRGSCRQRTRPVSQALRRLERKGLVRRKDESFAFELTPEGKAVIVKHVAALGRQRVAAKGHP